MKRKAFVNLCMFIVVIFTFFSLSSVLKAQEKVIKLRYSNFFPPAHANSLLGDQWGKEVEKRTKGRVAITYYPGNTLAPPPQAYDAVVKGIADISYCLFAYNTGRFPLLEVIDYPLGYTSGLQATRLINAFYKKFKPKELGDVKVMYLHAHGPGLIQTKKKISKLEDINGLRIKGTGINAKIVKAYGGVPVTMPMPETYDALQKGLADGIILPIEALKGWKFGELIKCTLRNYGIAYTVGMYVVMNKDKWNSLPPDVQQIIEKLNEEYIEKQGRLWDQLDKEGLEFVKGLKGHAIVDVTKEAEAKAREKMKPILDDYVQMANAKGLPGEEALRFCLDWLKKHP